MKILNLHGYAANAENTACHALKACDYEVISPQMDYDQQNPDTIFGELLKLYESEHCQAVVGSSLGGYFSMLIASEMQCPAVLINPCLNPFQTLLELGFDHRESICQYIALFSHLAALDFSKTYAIIGQKDDVITTHPMIQYLLGDQHCILVPEGGHAGSTLPLEDIFRNHQDFFAHNSADC